MSENTIYVPNDLAEAFRYVKRLGELGQEIYRNSRASAVPTDAEAMGSIRNLIKLYQGKDDAIETFRRVEREIESAHERAGITAHELMTACQWCLDSAHETCIEWCSSLLNASEKEDDESPILSLDQLRKDRVAAIAFWKDSRERIRTKVPPLDLLICTSLMFREMFEASKRRQPDAGDVMFGELTGFEKWDMGTPDLTTPIETGPAAICDTALDALGRLEENPGAGMPALELLVAVLSIKRNVLTLVGWAEDAIPTLVSLAKNPSPDFLNDAIMDARREVFKLRFEALKHCPPAPPASTIPADTPVFLEYHSANFDDPGDYYFFEAPDEALARRLLDLLRIKFPSREQNFRCFRIHTDITDPAKQQVIRERIQLIAKCIGRTANETDYKLAAEADGQLSRTDVEHYVACRQWQESSPRSEPPAAVEPDAPRPIAQVEPTQEQPETNCDGWIRITDFAEQTGVYPGTISRAADDGKIIDNGEKGHGRRISAASANRWFTERKKRNSDDL